MNLENKRVIVVGLGKSGQAAARLCLSKGARVLATDSRSDVDTGDLPQRGVELCLGGHDQVHFTEADLVVVSPGVPPLKEFSEAEQAGVEVIGELELACRYLEAPIIAVGGTNGKSTTTTLIERLLQDSGRVFAGGNLGAPPSDAVGQQWDYLVLEVSSFQLERAPRFRPRVSVLLNITEDHLDRYPSFADYAQAKGNAFVNQGSKDAAVIPYADTLCEHQAARGQGRTITFGGGSEASGQDAAYRVYRQYLMEKSTGERLELRDVKLHGEHNLLNLAAAVAAVRDLGVSWDSIAAGLESFEPLAHRMQRVREHSGVNFYDDSKGTNVGAAVTALRGLSEARCVLIAGGRDKHGAYEPLVEALRDKGRALVVIGEASERIAAAAAGVLPIERAASMEEAVVAAAKLARSGDAVLLSPACSSFDMFGNYKERGEAFASAVRAL